MLERAPPETTPERARLTKALRSVRGSISSTTSGETHSGSGDSVDNTDDVPEAVDAGNPSSAGSKVVAASAKRIDQALAPEKRWICRRAEALPGAGSIEKFHVYVLPPECDSIAFEKARMRSSGWPSPRKK